MEGQLSGVKEAGVTYGGEEEKAPISRIIDVLNEKLGTDFRSGDQLFFDQMVEDMKEDEGLAKQARNNSLENFRFGFEDKFMDFAIDRMDQNQELFAKLMDDDQMAKLAKEMIMNQVFKWFREK